MSITFRLIFHQIIRLLFLSTFSLIFLSCDVSIPVEVDSLSGNVVKIIDGDTYDLILNGEQTRVRMYGIDAPERGMDYYRVAKDYLGELCNDQIIRLEVMNTDRYGRIVAKSFLSDGRELGAEMIKAGLAWHYKQYSDDESLALLENDAQENKVGLWKATNPTPPWKYRKRKKEK